jgi:AcrR family transcriptional regulator
MSAELPAETIKRIVIASEQLFAENGYDGTTLRQITRIAKVNLAAVNYHHGDKESLYLEILRRRIQPINQTRLARLAKAETEAGDQPVPLAVIFRLMAEPFFGLFADPEDRGRHAARLIGRSLIEPLPFMDKFLTEEFQPVMARYGQALRRHAPALPPGDFLWRFSFVVGAMLHTLASLHRMKFLTRGICSDHDHAAALSRFVQFASEVFRPGLPPGELR